jgi:hypothetical protein
MESSLRRRIARLAEHVPQTIGIMQDLANESAEVNRKVGGKPVKTLR